MPRSVDSFESQPYRHFLGDFDIEQELLVGLLAVSAFVDEQARPREYFGVVFHQPARTIESAGFLVSGCHEDDIPVQRHAGPLQAHERGELGNTGALHVQCATSPQVAVPNLAGERVARPVLRIGRHDIRVLQQDQGRLVAAFQARPDIPAAWRALRLLVRNTLRLENIPDEFHGATLVAGRIDRIDADVLLEPAQRFVLDGLRTGRQGDGQEGQDKQAFCHGIPLCPFGGRVARMCGLSLRLSGL